MADPIPIPDDPGQGTQTDFLGRISPTALTGQPALPVAGPAAGVSAGPTGPGGAGATPMLALPGAAGGMLETAGGATSGPSASLRALLAGGKFAELASRLFTPGVDPTGAGTTTLSPETEHALEVQRAGERQDFTGATDIAGQTITPATIPDISASTGGGDWFSELVDWLSTGASEAGGLLEGGLPALGTAAVAAALPEILQLFTGGGDWAKFPGKVAETLTNTEQANETLATALATANDSSDIAGLIARWKESVGTHVGNFGAGSGPFAIPSEPGAGGSKHEGGVNWSFDPEVAGLGAEVQTALEGRSTPERIAALHRAMQGGGTETRTPEQIAAWQAEQQANFGAQNTPEALATRQAQAEAQAAWWDRMMADLEAGSRGGADTGAGIGHGSPDPGVVAAIAAALGPGGTMGTGLLGTPITGNDLLGVVLGLLGPAGTVLGSLPAAVGLDAANAVSAANAADVAAAAAAQGLIGPGLTAAEAGITGDTSGAVVGTGSLSGIE